MSKILKAIKNKFIKPKDDKNQKIITVILTAGIVIVFLWLSMGGDWGRSNRDQNNNILRNNNGQVKDVKFELSICTDIVKQPECYAGEFPEPILTWNCHAGKDGEMPEKYKIIVQIDDSEDFSSPEFDTGEIILNDSFFKINEDFLISSSTYYWRIKGQNNMGEWSGWAPGDSGFVVNPICR